MLAFGGVVKTTILIWAKRLLFGSMGHYRFGHPHLCTYLEGQGVPGSLRSPKHGRTTILETEIVIFKCFPHTHWFWEERFFWNKKTSESEHLGVRPEKKNMLTLECLDSVISMEFLHPRKWSPSLKKQLLFLSRLTGFVWIWFCFSNSFFENKNTALGLCNCSYLEDLQVQVSNFQVSGRNLWWFKGFQISEPWRIMVLPAYRAIGIGLTPITGPFLFAQAAMDLAHLVWGHSLAMTAWPWRHFKGLKVFFSECNFPKGPKMWHICAC